MEDTPRGLFDHAHFYSWRQKIRGMENWNGSNFSNDHLKCSSGQDLQDQANDMQIYFVQGSPEVKRSQMLTFTYKISHLQVLFVTKTILSVVLIEN